MEKRIEESVDLSQTRYRLIGIQKQVLVYYHALAFKDYDSIRIGGDDNLDYGMGVCLEKMYDELGEIVKDLEGF